MRAMALKDCMEAIMFLWRLRGSTMQSETAKSRTIRKLPDTWKRELHTGLQHRGCAQHPSKSATPPPTHTCFMFPEREQCKARINLKSEILLLLVFKRSDSETLTFLWLGSVISFYSHWVPLLLYTLCDRSILKWKYLGGDREV